MTHRTMAFSLKTLSIIGSILTLCINDTQHNYIHHNDTQRSALMALNLTTLSIITFSIGGSHAEYRNAECCFCQVCIFLLMLSVDRLNVALLNVIAPLKRLQKSDSKLDVFVFPIFLSRFCNNSSLVQPIKH